MGWPSGPVATSVVAVGPPTLLVTDGFATPAWLLDVTGESDERGGVELAPSWLAMEEGVEDGGGTLLGVVEGGLGPG